VPGSQAEKQSHAIQRLSSSLIRQFAGMVKEVMLSPLASREGKAFSAGMLFHLAVKAKEYSDKFPARADQATIDAYQSKGLSNLMHGIGAFAKGAIIFGIGNSAVVGIGNFAAAVTLGTEYAALGVLAASIAPTAVTIVTVVLAGYALFVGLDEIIAAFPQIGAFVDKFIMALKQGSGGIFDHTNVDVCKGPCRDTPGTASSPEGASAASNAALASTLAAINGALLPRAPEASEAVISTSAASLKAWSLPGNTLLADPVYTLLNPKAYGGWQGLCASSSACELSSENVLTPNNTWKTLGIYFIPDLVKLVRPRDLKFIGITLEAAAPKSWQQRIQPTLDAFNNLQRKTSTVRQGNPPKGSNQVLLQPKGGAITGATPIRKPKPTYGEVVK
jgi:hypothetical protein